MNESQRNTGEGPAWSTDRRSGALPGGLASGASPHGISVVEVLLMLRRWWWQCGLAGTALGALAASIVWWTFVPTYEATAWLEIKDETPFIAFPDRSNTRAFAQTQLETIRSAIVLSRVAGHPEIANCPEAHDDLAPEQWLTKGLRARFVGQSELCEVTFRSKSPAGAAQVANLVVKEYLALHEDESSRQTEHIIRLLNDQQRDRKAEVEGLRDSVRTLTKKTTGRDPVLVGNRSSTRGSTGLVVPRNPLVEAEDQVVKAEVDEAMLSAELKAVEEALAAEKVEVSERDLQKALARHPDIQYAHQKLTKLVVELSGYNQTSARGSNEHVLARKQKAVDDAKRALEERQKELAPPICEELEALARVEQQESVKDLQLELDRVRRVRSEWERRVGERRKEMEKHGDEAVLLEFAHDDLVRSEEVYAKIAERIVALKTEKVAPTRAVSRQGASVPLKPVEEVPYKRFALAGLGAFCFPFALAFLWERWMRRISDGKRVSRESNLPVLGEIASLPNRAASGDDASHGFTRDRITFEESVDALRVTLTLSREFQDVKTLVVTSAVSREGKTSLASALAISLAHACHEPLLLIDADMRAPDLHDMFNTPYVPGLAEVLAGECRVDDAIVERIASDVDLLPAGQLTTSPHALLRNGAFGGLLADVATRYRYVIIDAPPVLSASESMVIANACDGVLICTRCDFTRGHQLRAASERLAGAGARLLGAVISAVPTRLWAHRYGGYGYGWERYTTSRRGLGKSPATDEGRAGPNDDPDLAQGAEPPTN